MRTNQKNILREHHQRRTAASVFSLAAKLKNQVQHDNRLIASSAVTLNLGLWKDSAISQRMIERRAHSRSARAKWSTKEGGF